MVDPTTLLAAYAVAREELLAERARAVPAGELSQFSPRHRQ
jgi:hypothetical protein